MNTFCVLPWYSNEILQFKSAPCCLLPKSADVNQIKKDLLSGVKSTACNACWQAEASGAKSRRQTSNMFLEHALLKDMSDIRNDCINGNTRIMLCQVAVSNLCNQACVSCSSRWSSKWAALDNQMGKNTIPLYRVEQDNLQIDYHNLKKLELVGGEPLFDPTTFEILEKLLKYNNTECLVSFVTNGSVEINSKYLDLLSKFKNLSICVSIDGTGSVFEYMRWPTKWETLLTNLEQYKSVAKYITASYTISSINALYYDQTMQWFSDMSIPVSHNVVSYPTWLNFESIPTKLKYKLLEKNNFVTTLLDPATSGIELSAYRKEIIYQDTAKRINLKQFMPEVAEIISYDSQ